MLKRLIGPRFTLPAIAVLVAAVASVSAVAATRDGGSTPTPLVIQSCNTQDDPNCRLRQPAHMHADFAVFIRGEQVDFNRPEWVTDERSGGDHHPYLHIHPERYTVVHVHLSGSTWSEFFASLGFKLVDPSLAGIEEAETCLTFPDGASYCSNEREKLRFFRNGVEVDGIALTDIADLERVLITYGDLSDEEVAAQLAAVTDESCILSGWCKAREIPGEVEQCAGLGACN
jgi:hypothetical protein